jgi:uncharacterized protein (TIGR00369 family)
MIERNTDSLELIPNRFPGEHCFFCGEANPRGLKLEFYENKAEPGELVCIWVPDREYAGFGRVLHGGIQTGLCDEIMGWTTWHVLGEPAVTGSIHIDFVRPLYVEQRIEARCRIESREGKVVGLRVEIRDQEGDVCTKATGTYVQVKPDTFEELVGAAD